MSFSTSRLWIVFSEYLRNYYRSRSFYMMLAMSLIISAIMMYFSLKYGGSLQFKFGGISLNSLSVSLKENIILYLWGFVLSYLPVFSAVFFGSPAISSEIENGTAYHVFPLPIRRSTLLVGKLMAAIAVSSVVVSIYSVFEIISLEIMYGTIPGELFALSYLLLLLFVVSITSFTFLISSIFNKNLYAYITVFLLYYLIFNAVYIVLAIFYDYSAFFLLSQAASMVERVFVDLNNAFVGGGVTLNGAGTGEILTSIIVMLLYTVVSVAGSLVLFDRKEVK